MSTPPQHDYEKDGIEEGFNLLRRIAHVLEIVENFAIGILAVVFGTLIGAVAGAALRLGWIGILAGAVLGAAGGVWLARRKLLRETMYAGPLPERPSPLHGPHMPGVAERFARSRRRVILLLIPLGASFCLLLLMAKGAGKAPPFPPWMFEARSIAILFGVAALSLVLIAVNSRCPQCGRRLPDVIRIRQCPHCGVALRD